MPSTLLSSFPSVPNIGIAPAFVRYGAPAEKDSPAREYTIVKVKGPCIVCEREIEYPNQWPSDEEHALKQFKPKRREKTLNKLREGVWAATFLK